MISSEKKVEMLESRAETLRIMKDLVELLQFERDPTKRGEIKEALIELGQMSLFEKEVVEVLDRTGWDNANYYKVKADIREKHATRSKQPHPAL